MLHSICDNMKTTKYRVQLLRILCLSVNVLRYHVTECGRNHWLPQVPVCSYSLLLMEFPIFSCTCGFQREK